MTHDLGDPAPLQPEAELLGPEDQAESIAEAYEEEAALAGGPDDLHSLDVRVNKLEARVATIEDYLGSPSSGTLEDRLRDLEGRNDGRADGAPA